ncbi:MAG: ABC transporter ATP-binding protein [Fimbriimonadaceae bacterium]|nr:ABC transporter ATP-binding protein [Fimbriimonadaceae bacterium]
MNHSVELRQITKDFGAVRALDAVDFSALPGQIHALVGENGAGKTTLMRVLYGALDVTSGTVLLDGNEVSMPNSAAAIARGIGMVSQHYSIIPALTTLDNLMLGAEPSFALDRKAATERAEALAKQMGFSFRWTDKAEALSPASAQKLEILKLLWREARIMILDEPTAMLSPLDADALYGSLKRLANEGATIIVVTHRLPEVFEFCDQVTVLRGGKLITTQPVPELTPATLAELIVGRPVEIPSLPESHPGKELLSVREIQVKGDRGDDALKSVSFDLHAGEVVGIAGVDGNGQKELFEALMGLRDVYSGEVFLGGIPITDAAPVKRLEGGFRLIPEDRHHEGVIEEWSLTDNVGLGLQNQPPIADRGRLDRGALERTASAVAERFRTKHGGLDQPMASLSGGNQQRFVAARAISGEPKVVLAFQPARGLDLAGIADVYAALRDVSRSGGGVLVVSYDLEELLTHCDRVIVLCHGHLAEPDADAARDRGAIGRLMVGVGE